MKTVNLTVRATFSVADDVDVETLSVEFDNPRLVNSADSKAGTIPGHFDGHETEHVEVVDEA